MSANASPQHSHRLRFSIRSMLALMAIVAGLLWYAREYVVPWWQEHRQIVALRQTGVQVYTEPQGQYMHRQLVGDSLSERALFVHLSGPQVTDASLKDLGQLKHTEVLSINSPNVTDQGLKNLYELSNLKSLNLRNTQVTSAGISELCQRLPQLRLVQSN